VVIALPGSTADLPFARLVAEESQAGRVLGLDHLLILNRLSREPRLMPAAAAVLIQKSDAVAEAVLADLASAGLIEAQGASVERGYHLSAATYQRLDKRRPVIRRHGLEALQQVQVIVEYVGTHGTISRAEAAELCRLTEPQAYRVLQRLARDGTLRPTKQRGRGVRYENAR
jgi:ATP-dependent DNA helicase RecG